MDLHIVPGVKAKEAAEAHRKDILLEEEYGCKCLTYWIDESRGHVFCLIDAPSKKAVDLMHARAHGLVPYKIIEVQSSLVESFLGRVSDPKDVHITEDGLPFFNDPTFRILMVISMTDPILLQHRLGKKNAEKLIDYHNTLVRKELTNNDGVEIQTKGHGFIISFKSAKRAVKCALAIHDMCSKETVNHNRVHIAIHAGEPVSANEQIFRDTIQLAERLCFIAKNFSIGISAKVKELISKYFHQSKNATFTLWPKDEKFLTSIFNALEQNWNNANFNIEDFCKTMGMSRSQLYRKTKDLCHCPPSEILLQLRLDKARQLMKKERKNISEVTFNSGFSSPSYFTKCFKKEYGITPLSYQEMLH